MTSISDYDIGGLLGKGGFASVYKSRSRKTGEEVAIKIISQSKKPVAANEIAIHSQCRHSNIIQFRNSFEDEDNIYLILDCCRINLFKYLKSQTQVLSEFSAGFVIKQILQAVQYLHAQGIIHRDIKLSNILIQEVNGVEEESGRERIHVVLCDFGLAIQLSHPDEEHFTLCGTPNYIPPEMAKQSSYSFPADLWAAGCLFYSLITGTPPFDQAGKIPTNFNLFCLSTNSSHYLALLSQGPESLQATLRSIVHGSFNVPIEISSQALSFLNCLLHLVSTVSLKHLPHLHAN